MVDTTMHINKSQPMPFRLTYGDIVAFISAGIVLLGFVLAMLQNDAYQIGAWWLLPVSGVAGIALTYWGLTDWRGRSWAQFMVMFVGLIGFVWVATWFISQCTIEVAVSANIALAGAGTLMMIFQGAIPRPPVYLVDDGAPQTSSSFNKRLSDFAERMTFGRISGNLALYIMITVAALVAMIPFMWMISTSLMTLGETLNRQYLPGDALSGLCNYVEAWQEAEFSQYFANSVIITVVTITGLLITSILSAYAFARINFIGRNTIFTLLLITLMIPESVTLIPNYLIITGFIPIIPSGAEAFPFVTLEGSWLNTLTALTLPFMASAFSIFLLRQFFATIPNELWEACRIDGGGHFRFLIQIVLPISRAPVLTVTLLTFIGTWNAFLWPLIVTTNETWRPLMVGLYNFTSEAGTDTHLLMAGSFITILPMLLLYFLTQKSFTEGIATSGLKG